MRSQTSSFTTGRLAVASMLSLLVSACGGGGSSDASSDPAAMRLSFDRTTVSISAPERAEGVYPMATFYGRLSDLPDEGVYLSMEGSENGILEARFIDTGPKTFAIELRFNFPEWTDAGVYTDTITVTACLDEACTRHMAGSPQTLTSHYTVTPVKVTDAAETRLSGRLYYVNAADVAWDAQRDRLLVATTESYSKFPSSLVSLVPDEQVFKQELALPYYPYKLAISHGGQHLFVESRSDGTTNRYALPSLAFEAQRHLPYEFSLRAGEIAPHPELEITYATALETGFNSPFVLRVYDDVTKRPKEARSPTRSPEHVCWQDASTLWGSGDGTYSGNDGLFVYTVDAEGLTESLYVNPAIPIGDVLCGGALAHTTKGLALDPADGTVVRNYVPTGYVALNAAIDPILDRYYLLLESAGKQLELRSFVASTGELIASVNLYTFYAYESERMIRWGADGLAIVNAGQLLVLQGSFVTE